MNMRKATLLARRPDWHPGVWVTCGPTGHAAATLWQRPVTTQTTRAGTGTLGAYRLVWLLVWGHQTHTVSCSHSGEPSSWASFLPWPNTGIQRVLAGHRWTSHAHQKDRQWGARLSPPAWATGFREGLSHFQGARTILLGKHQEQHTFQLAFLVWISNHETKESWDKLPSACLVTLVFIYTYWQLLVSILSCIHLSFYLFSIVLKLLSFFQHTFFQLKFFSQTWSPHNLKWLVECIICKIKLRKYW